MVLDGVLRGEHEKGLGQRMRVVVHGDLRFVHRFEQRGLRLRRGAVDFVGHDDVGEDRAGLELEFLRDGVVDADADHVARQHVGGELNALERAVERARDGVGEGGLADARNVLDEQVAAREQRHQRHLDGFFLALHDAGDGALKFADAAARRWKSSFAIRAAFCYKKWVRAISSVVRALPSHGRGPRFKSLIAHHPNPHSAIVCPVR